MAALKRFPGDQELEQRGFVGAHKLHAYLLAAQAARQSNEYRRALPHERTSVSVESQPSDRGEKAEPFLNSQPSDRRETSNDGEPPQPSDRTENPPTFRTSERASRSSGRLSSVRLSKPRRSTFEGGPDAAEEDPPGEVAGRPLHERLAQVSSRWSLHLLYSFSHFLISCSVSLFWGMSTGGEPPWLPRGLLMYLALFRPSNPTFPFSFFILQKLLRSIVIRHLDGSAFHVSFTRPFLAGALGFDLHHQTIHTCTRVFR